MSSTGTERALIVLGRSEGRSHRGRYDVDTNNTLIVTGTNGNDIVALGDDATTVQVAFGADPANAHRFPPGDFNAILVSLGNGDDQFTAQSAVLSDKALTVDGGNGNDTITTGDGNDVIYAATATTLSTPAGERHRAPR